jgi:hypothetical protein
MTPNTATTIHNIRNKILLIILITGVLFISSQFVVMATVSTRGSDIGQIRAEQESLRLENEQLRSQINASKTTENIVGVLDTRFQTAQVKAQVIDPHKD